VNKKSIFYDDILININLLNSLTIYAQIFTAFGLKSVRWREAATLLCAWQIDIRSSVKIRIYK